MSFHAAGGRREGRGGSDSAPRASRLTPVIYTVYVPSALEFSLLL